VCTHRDKQAKIAITKWWKLKREISKVFKERDIQRGHLEGRRYGRRWQLAFKRWPQRYVEQPKGVETKLKILSGGSRKSKGLLWRRKNAIDICTMTGVWRKAQGSKEDRKASCKCGKGRAYGDLNQCLSTKDREKDLHRVARVYEKKTRDFNQVKCIKDEIEYLLVKEDEIRHRWREYFDKLFITENGNTTFQLYNSFDDTNMCFVC
jgi:hypothetical protein